MTTPRQKVQALDWQTPIVDAKTGIPSPQFMRLWQSLFQNEDGTNAAAGEAGDTAQQALDGLALKADKTRQIIAGNGLTGGGDLVIDRTLNVGAGTGLAVGTDDIHLTDTAVTPGTYGDATNSAQLTVDQQGRLTAVTNVPISGGGGGGGGSLALITRTVVSSAGPTISFSSIPGTYEDLIIVINGQLSGAADFVWASLNGDTNSSNYQWARGVFQAGGVTYGSGNAIGLNAGLLGPNGAGSLYADVLEATIYSYARTAFYKNSLARSTLRVGTAANQLTDEIQASNWLSTAAVTSIALTAGSGNFTVGTVASLYGRV